MDAPKYLWHYVKYSIVRDLSEPKRPVIIQVTTWSDATNLEQVQPGISKQRLQGFAVPRAFYVPKYYPENVVDQFGIPRGG